MEVLVIEGVVESVANGIYQKFLLTINIYEWFLTSQKLLKRSKKVIGGAAGGAVDSVANEIY